MRDGIADGARDEQVMTRMLRAHRYPEVNRCIYCGECVVEGGLTDEHIVPHSIGGALVLPKASCRECAKVTAAVEGSFAGQALRPVRRQFKFPHKSRGRAARQAREAERFPIRMNGRTYALEASLVPPLLMSFVYEPPSALWGGTTDGPIVGRVIMRDLPGFHRKSADLEKRSRNRKFGYLVRESAAVTARVLAKIAHTYAIAELGTDAFRPCLLPFLSDAEGTGIGTYVGSAIPNVEGDFPIGQDLHNVSIDDADLGRRRLVVVRVQLWACFGFPVHLVVVGDVNQGASKS